MRLKQEIKESIIYYARKYFGYNIKLYLFGSRTDDNKKGGDIDLFIETMEKVDINTEIDFLKALYKNATSRKIDLLIKTPYRQDKPIYSTAINEGIRLC